jgi:hypothetical protein
VFVVCHMMLDTCLTGVDAAASSTPAATSSKSSAPACREVYAHGRSLYASGFRGNKDLSIITGGMSQGHSQVLLADTRKRTRSGGVSEYDITGTSSSGTAGPSAPAAASAPEANLFGQQMGISQVIAPMLRARRQEELDAMPFLDLEAACKQLLQVNVNRKSRKDLIVLMMQAYDKQVEDERRASEAAPQVPAQATMNSSMLAADGSPYQEFCITRCISGRWRSSR